MNSFVGDNVFVTLEFGDGRVHKFKALTACLTTNYPYNNVVERRFEFMTIDEVVTTQSEIKSTVEKAKQSNEWACGYCGTPNEKKIKSCHKCGAPRSFVYED
jgi:rubrerythrin